MMMNSDDMIGIFDVDVRCGLCTSDPKTLLDILDDTAIREMGEGLPLGNSRRRQFLRHCQDTRV